MPSTLDIFCCYAHQDRQLLDKLISHLMPLQRQGLIKIWHEADIAAGRSWEDEVNKHLNTAHIILLLISPDFMVSDYCYSKEMQRAMLRYKRNEARVIPVLLRPTDYKGTPFAKLQMLPNGGRAIMDRSWHTDDEALLDVTNGISIVVYELLLGEASKLMYGDLRRSEHYKSALGIYEQIIRREPYLALAYRGQGKALLGLRRYEESLQAYEKAFQIDAKVADGSFYQEKAQVLSLLQRFEECLDAYDEAIRCNPRLAALYAGKAGVFYQMQRYREALAMYEQAIRLEPDNAEYYVQVGDLLQGLRRFEEALDMYGKAIQLGQWRGYYAKKGKLLLGLKRFEEALATYDQYSRIPQTELSDWLNPQLYDEEGQALLGLHRYKEALDIDEKLIGRLKSTQVHYRKGKALFGLERYEEALVAYDEAIRLSGDNVDPEFYRDKGKVYECLAGQAYDEMVEKKRSQGPSGKGKNGFLSLPFPAEKLTELRTLSGHTSGVSGVTISPDGRAVVSGSDDHTIKIWNLSTGQELFTLKGHTRDVWGVAISPDGRTVVSGSDDRTIKVWDFRTGQEVHTLIGHTDLIYSVAISQDGRTVVSGSYDHTIKIWNLSTGQESRTLVGHTDAVNLVAISPDGQIVVSGSDDYTIKVWNLATGHVYTLTGHTGRVDCVAISPDGQTVVSGSGDKTIKVWDMDTGKELRTLSGHTGPVYSVAVSGDGQTVVSGSGDKTIKIWGVR